MSNSDPVCECGDYRSDHPNDGPCRHNSRAFDLCHAGQDCMKYRPTPQGDAPDMPCQSHPDSMKGDA